MMQPEEGAEDRPAAANRKELTTENDGLRRRLKLWLSKPLLTANEHRRLYSTLSNRKIRRTSGMNTFQFIVRVLSFCRLR